MKRKEKEFEIIMEIYRRIYKVATPSVDFDDLPYMDKNSKFFDDYTIKQEVMDEIIENAMKEFKIKKRERLSYKNTIYLGCSPRFEK